MTTLPWASCCLSAGPGFVKHHLFNVLHGDLCAFLQDSWINVLDILGLKIGDKVTVGDNKVSRKF